jgi:hypothetical protein
MSREYVIPMNTVSLAPQAVTLVYFQVMSSTPICAIEILRAACSQRGSDTSHMVGVQFSTQVSAFPTLTSQAPVKIKAGDPVSLIVGGTAGAAGTSGINASAEGAGSKTVIYPDNFNVLNGWSWVATPDEKFIETPQSTAHGFGLHLPTAPTSTTSWSALLVIREIG